MALDIIPISAVLLIIFSIILMVRYKRKNPLSLSFFILNGVMFTVMVAFYMYYLLDPYIFINLSAWMFWILIIIGLVLEIFCLYKRYIPGQITAAAIHLFVVFPTIFSIGGFLMILASIELIIAIFYMMQKYQATR